MRTQLDVIYTYKLKPLSDKPSDQVHISVFQLKPIKWNQPNDINLLPKKKSIKKVNRFTSTPQLLRQISCVGETCQMFVKQKMTTYDDVGESLIWSWFHLDTRKLNLFPQPITCTQSLLKRSNWGKKWEEHMWLKCIRGLSKNKKMGTMMWEGKDSHDRYFTLIPESWLI